MSLSFATASTATYQSVDPAYKNYLRIHTSMTMLMLIGFAIIAWLLPWPLPTWIPFTAIALLLMLWLILLMFWVSRRYAVTQYAVGEDFISYRVGALWHKEVAVTFNRLQHTELARGPIERWLGISRLLLHGRWAGG